MSEHLKVDLDLLSDTAADLRRLVSEFNRGSRFGADAAGAVGHDEVADALDEFATNWRRHREKLTKNLEAVAEMAADSAKTYKQTDDELARSLENARRAP